MPDFNTWDNVSRIYNGFFLIHDGNTAYKYQRLLQLDEIVSANYSVHYGTSGDKKLASTGHNSQCIIKIENTADLYDTRENSTDKKSLSYFIAKIIDNEIPEIEFEGIEVTDAEQNKFIHNRFKGGIVDVKRERDISTGVYTVQLIIEITDRIVVRRTDTE